MYRTLTTCLFVSALAISTVSSASTSASDDPMAPRKTLSAFANEHELAVVFKRWGDEAKRRRDGTARAFRLEIGRAHV